MSALVVQGVCAYARVPCAGVLFHVSAWSMCYSAPTNWITSVVLRIFTARVWVNNCSPWNQFCFIVSLSKLTVEGYVCTPFLLLFTFSCRIWFDDISVWYSDICSFLIHSVELCGSSLEDCHLHGNSGNSVLWNLFCWRHHMTWCNLLLNVLAIFMVEEFYIYAVVHFFQSVMYESNTKVAGQKLEYQRQCSIPCNKMFSWCENT